MFTEEQLKNMRVFLVRSTMSGQEVVAYIDIMNKIEAELKELEVKKDVK